MIFRENGHRPDVTVVPKPKECFISSKKISEMAQILKVAEDELVDAVNEFLPVREKTKKEDGISYNFVYCKELSAEEIFQSTGVRLPSGRKGIEMRLLVKSTEKPHTRTASDFFVFVKDPVVQGIDRSKSKKFWYRKKDTYRS